MRIAYYRTWKWREKKKKTEIRGKREMHTVAPGIWQKTMKKRVK